MHPPPAVAAVGPAGAVLGAVLHSLFAGPGEPVVCPHLELPQENWVSFVCGVGLGLAILPLAELVLVVRRVWATGLAATLPAARRPAALPSALA